MPTSRTVPDRYPKQPPKQISLLDIWGHSAFAESGASVDVHGMAHKIDSMLQPAIFDSVAIGGAVHSWHERGNCAQGDGGWARILTEMDRQDQVLLKGATVSTGNTSAGSNIVVAVAERAYFAINEYVIYGKGTTAEKCQITAGVPASGAGNITLLSCANAHSTGDAFYHAPSNEGYLAKSQLSIGATGENDLGYHGPFAQGTFGTTPGASRGLIPYQESLKFTLAQMRCSIIFKNNHPVNYHSAGWTKQPATTGTSFPEIFFMGGGTGGNYSFASANSETIEFSTPPDFPGGTVDVFFLAYDSGNGCDWNLAVTGATTITTSAAFTTKNKNAVDHNAASSVGKRTGVVGRIKSLNAGVNKIVLTTASISGFAVFLGWGIESPKPPLVYVALGPRKAASAWGGTGYSTRAPTLQTATVAAGAGTGAGSVTLGSAVTIGTTGANILAVYPGDTITIGYGLATQETRRITAVNTTTTVTVDANFVNAHTGEACRIGYQDADIVGGGYVNKADTQGATSVPGLHKAIRDVILDFDDMVEELNLEIAVNGSGALLANPLNFNNDQIHQNDQGQGLAAVEFKRVFDRKDWPPHEFVMPTVKMARTPLYVYGDAGASPASGGGARLSFSNGWTNLFPGDTSNARTSVYQDFRTRQVFLHIAVYGGTEDSTIFGLPVGYLPNGYLKIVGEGPAGPAILTVPPSGLCFISSGYAPHSSVAGFTFDGSWIAQQ